MPSFEEELVRQVGGRGHVRFGRSNSFAAGYVCILLAALAGICLAQSVTLKVPGNAVVAATVVAACWLFGYTRASDGGFQSQWLRQAQTGAVQNTDYSREILRSVAAGDR
jgi:hypothetical protein